MHGADRHDHEATRRSEGCAAHLIVNPRGTYAVAPAASYRFSDQLVGDLRYVLLTGGFFGTGFFRDRDQVTARITYLLN
jgi:hypothetical protein